MEVDQWQKIEDLYHEALSLPAHKRSPFLESACHNDAQLRTQVESLLREAGATEQAFLKDRNLVADLTLLNEDAADLIGKQIGRYRLVGLLGQGGMGDVYLAEDPQLDRLVALKLLPTSLSSDQEVARRFRREARAASSISHPNVASIYDIGVFGTHEYIVMEYVEGKTLRRLMKTASLGLPDALKLVLQIAQALIAAHEAGVFHRDIKPENVVIRSDGTLKVLDFGLAKLSEEKVKRSLRAREEAQVDTQPGVVMGTAAYMSPEQVRGQQVDGRSDLWSLGVVLYELLASRKPFEGETPSDISAAILLKEPAPLPREILPVAMRQIIAKALAKDLNTRYQTAAEFAADLEQVLARLTSKKYRGELERLPHQGRGIGPITAMRLNDVNWQRMSLHTYRKIFLLLLFVFLIMGLIRIGRLLRRGLTSQVADWHARKLTGNGRATRAAISPDGKSVAYVLEEVGRQGLYVRSSAATTDAVTLLAPAALEFMGVAFSPDCQSVYYSVKRSEEVIASLYRMPAAGGAAQQLLTDVDSAPSFSPDGKQIVFLRQGSDGSHESLCLAGADGGEVKTLYTRRMLEFIPIQAQPAWSPDGKVIVCAVGAYHNSVRKMQIVAVRVADGSVTTLGGQAWTEVAQTVWSRDSNSLIAAAREQPAQEQRQLWRISYPDGQTSRITQDLADYFGVSLARDGRSLVTVAGSRLAKLYVADLQSSGMQMRQITLGGDDGYGVIWLADGRIVYGSDAGGNPDLWVTDALGTNRKQLTAAEAVDADPSSAPHGGTIVFTSTRTGSRHIWRINADGSDAHQLTEGSGEATPVVTPDGKQVLFFSFSAGAGTLEMLPIMGGKPTVLATGMPRFPAVSRDSQRLAFACRLSGATSNKICVVPFSNPSAVPQVYEPVSGARSPGPVRWLPDSSGFSYIVTRQGVGNVWAQALDGSAAKQVTSFTEGQLFTFDWSHDGKQLVCARGELAGQVVLFERK